MAIAICIVILASIEVHLMAQFDNPAMPDYPVFDNEAEANDYVGKKKDIHAVKVGVVWQVMPAAKTPEDVVSPSDIGTDGNTLKSAPAPGGE